MGLIDLSLNLVLLREGGGDESLLLFESKLLRFLFILFYIILFYFFKIKISLDEKSKIKLLSMVK